MARLICDRYAEEYNDLKACLEAPATMALLAQYQLCISWLNEDKDEIGISRNEDWFEDFSKFIREL